MSRRKRGKVEITLSDLGPIIQRERGDLVVVDATDPERPASTPVRRAMRQPHYAAMHAKRTISDDQRNCCDRYAILHERLSGAVWTNGERIAGGGHGSTKGHPTLTQVQASATITTAHRWIGNDAAALLQLFVVANHPIAEVAKRRAEREEVCKGRILAAIIRLEEHWGEKNG